MRSLLRDLDTGLLYARPGKWVQGYAEATNFEDPAAAEQHATTLAKTNLELLLLNDEGRPTGGFRISSSGVTAQGGVAMPRARLGIPLRQREASNT